MGPCDERRYAANETAHSAIAALFHAIDEASCCPIAVKYRPATEQMSATALPTSTRFFFMNNAPSSGCDVLDGTIPSRSAGFWNSDDTNSISYIYLEVKCKRQTKKADILGSFLSFRIGLKIFFPPQFKTLFAPIFPRALLWF